MAEKRFWANPATSPKRKYRFLLSLPNAGADASYLVTKVNRPSFNITEATHSYLNHTFYFPGRVEWQTVSFSIVDPVGPDATGLLVGILGASGYQIPANLAGNAGGSYGTMSKAAATSVMGIVQLSSLDANGTPVDTWKMHNCWMKNVTMGDYDYSDDSLVSMDVELRYDFATYQVNTTQAFPNTGVAPIGTGLSKLSDLK
jgi:hypothetical protein|tara:strand:- start:28 stop:630 length:603 start_codon:yes stop_codon:yes gene_type:complete